METGLLLFLCGAISGVGTFTAAGLDRLLPRRSGKSRLGPVLVLPPVLFAYGWIALLASSGGQIVVLFLDAAIALTWTIVALGHLFGWVDELPTGEGR